LVQKDFQDQVTNTVVQFPESKYLIIIDWFLFLINLWTSLFALQICSLSGWFVCRGLFCSIKFLSKLLLISLQLSKLLLFSLGILQIEKVSSRSQYVYLHFWVISKFHHLFKIQSCNCLTFVKMTEVAIISVRPLNQPPMLLT
jgi:hypothetical protein